LADGTETGTEGIIGIRGHGTPRQGVKSRVQGKIKRKKGYFGLFNRGSLTTTVSGSPDVATSNS